MARSLLFTLAVNGYSAKYRPLVQSQRSYAARLGCEFLCVERPLRVPEAAVGAWLKITLMNRWLRSDFDHVGYLDADCEVQPRAPDWRDLFDGEGSVLMSRGRSGRFNSGVIFARADRDARRFFGKVERSAATKIPITHRRNLKYENGNVDYVAERTQWVRAIGPEWNNSWDPDLADNIRHYTGPLRELYRPSRRDALMTRLVGLTVSAPPKQAPQFRSVEFIRDLAELTDEVVRRYTPDLPEPVKVADESRQP